MKKQKIGPVIGCFASSLLMASTHSIADGYFGSISASAVRTDNGNKSVDNKISELQEQYDLHLGASYENTIGKFEADYAASHRDFSENSQPNKSTLEGHSSLQLGGQSHLAELLVEHSRQTLLNKADSLDLTSNQDEREVITVVPGLNWHLSPANVIFLKGDFSDISYLENELNNSTRAGANLGVLHKITEVDSVQFRLQSTEIEFEYFPASNYSLRSATINYSASLRQLSYSLQVGGNQSETEVGEKYTAPSYLAALTFKSGVNTFGLNIAQELTDTSFGSGNKNTTDGSNSSDGGIGQSSQINRRSADAHWTTTALCDRCTLMFNVQQTRDQYLFNDKNATERGAGITGNYLISNAATMSVRLTQSEHKFPDITMGVNYKSTVATLEYSHRFGRNFNVKASYSDEKRVDDNASTGYREKLIGLNLSYSF